MSKFLQNQYSRVAKSLKLQHPIIQAPLGGVSTPELVAAISNRGGLGSFGAQYLAPSEIVKVVRDIKRKVKPGNPFAVNLWIPIENQDCNAIKSMEEGGIENFQVHRQRVAHAYKKFGIEPPSFPTRKQVAHDHDAQMQAVLESAPPVLSFIMGIPTRAIIEQAKAKGIYLIGTATTVEEAVLLEEAGVDAVVASGSDGGGHRGSFLKPANESLVGTMSLIPTMHGKITIPVIASGGISDSRGIVAAMCLGAEAVQIGSIFVMSHECGAPEAYKQALADPVRSNTTVLTTAWSGRMARGQPNQFIDDMRFIDMDKVPGYPIQNYLTSSLRKTAATVGDVNYMAIWSGQSASLSQRGSAEEIFDSLVNGCDGVVSKLVPVK